MQKPTMTERPETPAPAPTILVVDDNRVNRDLLREILEPAGYKVLEAADGDSGLKLAHSKRPECVLLDIRMPGLDGFAVLDRLKQDPVTREIPVFVLTATANQVGDVRRALEGGAAGYLLKPIDLQDTLTRIHAAIERYRSALET
jgi:CheY-like chemotaxis protein